MIIGLCNGILIAGIRVSPILATLGMMTLLKGINILITGGSAIANYPQWVLWLNHAQWFGIPLPMWLLRWWRPGCGCCWRKARWVGRSC